MSWGLALSGWIGCLLVLLWVGLPVFAAFLIVNLTAITFLFGSSGFGLITNSMYDTVTSESLATISMFILLGEILFRSGCVKVLFSSIDTLIGRLKGRLYFLSIILGTIFGALSGSALAVASMLGRSVAPDMVERGYDPKLTAFTIIGGAGLAPIIPPSIFAIIIGSLVSNVSIASLLIAGVGPGLVLSIMMAAYVLFMVSTGRASAGHDEQGRESAAPPGARAKLLAIVNIAPIFLIILAVMGFVLLGITTPTESAAAGVVGALLAALFYRSLNWTMLKEATISTVLTSAMIMLILSTSMLFSQLLALTGVTSGMVSFFSTLQLPSWLMFLILMLVPLFLCMFIDEISFMLLAIPLYIPIIDAYQFDPLWFWTMFLINLVVGTFTPPFGFVLFSLNGAYKRLDMSLLYRAALPVTALYLTGMFIFWLFPEIVTFFPSHM